MDNRPHKKEKPQNEVKEYFAKKVVQFIHCANPIVHEAPPKMTDSLSDQTSVHEHTLICQEVLPKVNGTVKRTTSFWHFHFSTHKFLEW